MNLDPPQLEQLRRAIDAIDDQLHDLLMKRTELAGQITAAKRAAVPGVDGAGFMRPGREAQVIRRLAARHHGPFPKLAMVQLWREIMSAFVGLQTPFTVAVSRL